MASSKVMASTSNSRNSDLSLSSLSPHLLHHHHHHHPPSSSSPMISPNSGSDIPPPITVDGILRNVYGDNNNNSGEITLIDAAGAISAVDVAGAGESEPSINRKTVDDIWREIVAEKSERKELKMEAPDEMMTLEDFLAKAGAEVEVEEEEEEGEDSKAVVPPRTAVGAAMERLSGGGGSSGGMFGFDGLVVQSPYPPPPPGPGLGEVGVMGFGNNGGGVGRGKRRGGPILEPLDKAAQQRQRRMIKNRESAARSRERKQAYQSELESLAVKLEEENEQLLREKAEWTKQRYKQLMEKVVPVVEKRKPQRALRRVRSTQW